MTLLDTAMAALVLECSERDVRRIVARGELTNVGTPRRILVRMEEVRALLTARA